LCPESLRGNSSPASTVASEVQEWVDPRHDVEPEIAVTERRVEGHPEAKGGVLARPGGRLHGDEFLVGERCHPRTAQSDAEAFDLARERPDVRRQGAEVEFSVVGEGLAIFRLNGIEDLDDVSAIDLVATRSPVQNELFPQPDGEARLEGVT
jgi:hypothetical protein